jgi:hypothetical protein
MLHDISAAPGIPTHQAVPHDDPEELSELTSCYMQTSATLPGNAHCAVQAFDKEKPASCRAVHRASIYCSDSSYLMTLLRSQTSLWTFPSTSDALTTSRFPVNLYD